MEFLGRIMSENSKGTNLLQRNVDAIYVAKKDISQKNAKTKEVTHKGLLFISALVYSKNWMLPVSIKMILITTLIFVL